MPGGDMVKVINNQSEFGQAYFYGNPEITFWKAAYRRHTNFAMEARKMTNRSVTEAFGTEVTYTIPRDQSDLMYKVHLDADLANPNPSFHVPFPGEKLIEYAEFRIGGTSISKRLTSDFLHCWHELTIPDGKKWAYRELVGNTNSGILTSGTVSVTIPIPFWFTKNPGVAFPRNAVKNDDVSIVIKYQAGSLMGRNNTQNGAGTLTGTPTISLYCTLIYLDEEERTRFQTARHEYLIEQVQTHTSTIGTTVNFNFDHHVKELIWFATNSTVTDKNDFFNYTKGAVSTGAGTVWTQSGVGSHQNENQVYPVGINTGDITIGTCQLKLDGSEMFVDGAMNTRYFTQLQPMYHHTSVPWTPGIFVYSFALKPEEYQPSGTLDFSSIKTQQLVFDSTTDYNNLTIMAVNYNILVISNGHANLVRNS